MKKLFIGALAATLSVLVGCHKDKVPTVDEMTKLAYTAGVTTAVAADLVDMDLDTKTVIIEVVSKVEICVPQVGQKFSDAWDPIAIEYINQLLSEGKISDIQSTLISNSFRTITKGIDWLVFTKYPKASESIELIETATKSFCKGFINTFRIPDEITAAPVIDMELFKYLTE